MKYLQGQLCLWCGFIGGALVAVRSEEIAEHPMATVTWWLYGVFIAVGVVGVVLLRRCQQTTAGDVERIEAEYSTLTSSMETMLTEIADLRDRCLSMAPSAIVRFIDERLAPPLSDFADSRNALIRRHGLNAFGDVMTQFASGERFTNRAWSAAADGYLDEVKRSVDRADLHLQEAANKMADLESGTMAESN